MKSILAFLLALSMWYVIISFITWNPNITSWHWFARVSLVVLSLLTWDKVDISK